MEKYVGFVVVDATVKTIEEGRQVVDFTIAKNRYFKAKDGTRHRKTTFVECAYWQHTAIAPYLLKGAAVEVTGDTGVRAYINKSGEAVGALTLNVREIVLLFSPKGPVAASKEKSSATSEAGAEDAAGTTDSVMEREDDLPF